MAPREQLPGAMSARPQRCGRGSGWRGAAVSPLCTVKCHSTSPSPCVAKGSATSRQDRRRERRRRESIPSPTTPLLPPALSLSRNSDLSQDAKRKANRAGGRKVFISRNKAGGCSSVSNSPPGVCHFLACPLVSPLKELRDQPVKS